MITIIKLARFTIAVVTEVILTNEDQHFFCFQFKNPCLAISPNYLPASHQ